MNGELLSILGGLADTTKRRPSLFLQAAKELLLQARQELDRDDLRQAAEKVWGAAALAVKAHAYKAEGRRLASHRELWQYTEKLAKTLGSWVLDAWLAANSMHTCVYEDWCAKAHIEKALTSTSKLVLEVEKAVRQGRPSHS